MDHDGLFKPYKSSSVKMINCGFVVQLCPGVLTWSTEWYQSFQLKISADSFENNKNHLLAFKHSDPQHMEIIMHI